MQHYSIHDQQNETEILDLINSSSMAVLLTGCDARSGVFNPVFFENRFYLHLNNSDLQFQDLKNYPRARLLFFDFLANIPSYWVHEKYAGAATSYYRWAEFVCETKCTESPAEVGKLCQLFLHKFQPEGGYAALEKNEKLYQSSFSLLGIAALTVLQRTTKWKLGQNRTQAQRRKIISALRARALPNDERAAREVEKWLEAEFKEKTEARNEPRISNGI